jgi:NADP-dependent 3-hydroxy acid dehydrogenase YdfG
VNNAGICEVGQVEWCGVETYLKLLQVNTLGVIRVTQAFLPLLRMTRGTRIVITASVAGIKIYAIFSSILSEIS